MTQILVANAPTSLSSRAAEDIVERVGTLVSGLHAYVDPRRIRYVRGTYIASREQTLTFLMVIRI